MRVLISCSKSKKIVPNKNLVWTDGATTTGWLESLDNSVLPRLHPKEMYIGRAVQEQVKIIESYNQEVWFISAGLGILNGGPGDPIIPSYEASFSVKGAGHSFKRTLLQSPNWLVRQEFYCLFRNHILEPWNPL